MKKNNYWFSVLISILIIGFLLILTVGTYNIVLRELRDSKWAFDYLKAFTAAEAAGELALLKIKEKGYWYYKKVNLDINNPEAIILSANPMNKAKFNKARDPLISYDLNSKTKEYNWNLWVWEFDIIPLFYIDNNWEHKVNNIELNIISWDNSKFTWNIIGKEYWISWVWEIFNITNWKWRFKDLSNPWSYIVEEKNVWNFLSNLDSNYLILMNIDPNNSIEYKLTSTKEFTLPRINILVSWKINKYKQNLNIFLDNTEYLGRSRYSIYSN